MSDGEIVACNRTFTVYEAQMLIDMFLKEAQKLAGEFYNNERSEKHRLNWPNEYEFANTEWKNFVAAARAKYVNLLNRNDVPEEHKQLMYYAIVLYDMCAAGKEQFPGVQIARDSAQFWGDKYENRKIMEQYGKAPNLRAFLKRSTTLADWTTKSELKNKQ